ncbi:MAG: phage portal protein [Clostridia bacterium]|nr:phage portal protein [Clostridia bacterium]
MGIFNLLKGRGKKSETKYHYIDVMNGTTPVFTQFGDNIYASDIVQGCIRCITSEMSKLKPQHIRTTPDGMQSTINSSINRLLKFKPNSWMTISDFLEKIVYIREVRKNVFIYPAYDEMPIKKGFVKREYTGLYPLNPTETEFLEDDSGEMYIKFAFANGYNYTMPYADIIHWRKDYGANDLMGGDINGLPNNKAMLQLLRADNTVIQGIEKSVKATSSTRGILKINSMLDDEKQQTERKKFEQKLENNESGILTLDIKGDFTPLTLDPKLIDEDTMKFIQQRILNNYGLSIAVYNGDFTEEQYQAFYEKKLEGDIISLGRCFSSTLFTQRELDVGNEIIFYNQGLMFTNMKNKISAVDILSSHGALTDNQILAVFGYPPYPEGNIRKQSLNYINTAIADTYQLSKRKGKENETL